MESLFLIIFWALQVYQLILLARVLMTWIPNLDYNNPIARFLYQATEPVLAPIRRALPQMGGIDLSPLVVFLGISVLMQLIF
ncbi:MAG: YggT family protein [Chloroflexota bacterium]|nr:YggT family protein [Chloroflexota bacterium]